MRRLRNPDMTTWLILGAVGVGGYLLWKQRQAAALTATATPDTAPSTTTDDPGSQGSTPVTGNILDPNGV